ncbi:TIGR00295 family protein [Methanopyrus kandleri]|uniref:Predicted HD superfamily hydrolase n=2 Tax=Methanopyrus kandleri TaxID=2320 RepID=Q8TY12_METKA|nr:TIGR00295 family protein [Methanopyrus kandleri]AAM01709.1 Predicted HD superfamily hydrolase [Methanopyrus kandleri AV19]HII70346.1 TIGR00295 family protein [Methanopyrus kandleri]
MRDPIRDLERVGCPEHVIEHCKAVCRLAEEMAERCEEDVDLNLVRTGALLHDIGRARTHGIDHAVVGANIVSELGYPKEVVRIVERHIGAGIPKDEAKKLGLPPKDYIPETLEEKIVAHADNLTFGTEHVPIKVVVRKFSERLGEDSPAVKRLIELHNELVDLNAIPPELTRW